MSTQAHPASDEGHERVRGATTVATRPRVLFTSTSYPSNATDWKGLFIQRMLEALSRRPDLHIEAWCPPGPLPPSVTAVYEADDDSWLHRISARGGIAHLLRKHPVQGLLAGATLVGRIRRTCRSRQPSLYHINWLQCALGLPHDRVPALVTILGTDLQLLRLPFVRLLLARGFRGRKVILCPNAEWMVSTLQSAFDPGVRVQCVPFGIDRSWYDVTRRITLDAPAKWLCVTRLTRGKLGPLFEWAAPLFAGTGRQLHLLGPRQDPTIQIPSWVHYHGPASPDELRSHWFPTATGLLSLSTHPEGRPQVMLEAMAAGLPILASANAAHLDLIQQSQTGWICPSPQEFESGLLAIEDVDGNLAMGNRARDAARRRFGDWDDCAARYATLYQALLQ